jgi:Bromodomain/Bromodomain extra-terminal - transcription regulation
MIRSPDSCYILIRLYIKKQHAGLTDYPTIIKTPMDLGTIKTKIKKREYKTLYQVAEDVRLVWSNCMTYNADGSDFFRLAEQLKKKWEEKYQKLLHDISSSNMTTNDTTGSGATTTSVPSSSTIGAITSGGVSASATPVGSSTTTTKSSLADKRNFAKLLYQISKEELGKVLVDVESRHPAAIKRNATEDEIVLNIDEIPGPLLQDLYNFVIS